ncbi:bifunctional phosphoribosylaminoimidazolecarboxamide formyltransferase/inosine monophosphate cyclohydrolase [Porphyromonas gingivalis]|uniref:Bifunctional purine biosynthesis protein PurH n=1 Tax=Porphyromonas gingivalis TaxID=837 RepID=A0AAF0BGN9_PORGN|nr:bifunctional phosphoribosylaminoimidazolecarboxamide formyltransferase/IMP cyclohydrolase [Porphyromonas gingivalis]MCE8180411.1 bifunctional phosphoribosylaminoimidazolecarboxamide formyltransferase/IMP cyclohydrolase [Porphyromonas gingivalis]QUI90385.1 bifunctional phosphoribosylaminoimidazolecarboxamide formyltransferase/IMP cyclohydrolase [Porphyromonas gingivalis]QUI92333.1 bifunctional phosphoribosylaminoimidazolecarboxamide formyltransferase/IMP cyclohydrolase [Porphyromonas gingivali
MEKVIRRALISVYHKEGLAEILAELNRQGVEFVSTGGTHEFITSLGYACRAVDDLTRYPSMLGGRVKTLHPMIFGGILARRGHESDVREVGEYGLPLIDLVIVDLYPFEATVASGASEEDIIEKIDIGGISLIRGAAKNFEDVVIISSRAQYAGFYSLLKEQGARTSLAERRHYAREAFAVSSAYDSAIFRYFDDGEQTAFRMSADSPKVLRYGENPHQRGFFFGNFDRYFDKLQGKEISYNNLQDIEAAVSLISEFSAPTFAILKHTNACGIASRGTLIEAWQAALAGDPVSAFGGILVTNTPIDKETAQEIDKIFFEVIIAPDYDNAAMEYLTRKTNRIILLQKEPVREQWQFRSMFGGVLMQQVDGVTAKTVDFKPVTPVVPTADETDDLIFANKVVKHSKSNAITLVKDSQLCASGVGQTSRVDALRQAIDKARNFGFDLNGAVMASDAFFPFADCVEIAAEAGIRAIIQPGGSIKDNLSIEEATKKGIAMVMTGVRHFKH